jgi:hypothetical protein
MTTAVLYLLAGTIIGYMLDRLVTSVDAKDKFTIGESLWAITLWPVLLIVFVHSFLQGLFESSGED